MTRINVVPVEELSDQNLRAEWKEIFRIFKTRLDNNAPDNYTLNKGHMLFARKHLKFIVKRIWQLYFEMHYRNFNANVFLAKDLCKLYKDNIIKSKNYVINFEDILVNRERLINNLKTSKIEHTWSYRQRPKYLER